MTGFFFHFLVIYSQFAGSVNQPLPPVPAPMLGVLGSQGWRRPPGLCFPTGRNTRRPKRYDLNDPRLMSVILIVCRLLIPCCSDQRSQRRTFGTSSRRGCLLTTSCIMGALLPSTRTNWIVRLRTCPSMMWLCTTSLTLGLGIWMLPTSHGMLQCVPCVSQLVWGIASGPWLLGNRTGSVCSVSLFD